MDANQKKLIEAIQTVVVIVAISLGILPLIQKILGAQQNAMFRFVFSEPTGTAQWILPVAVIAVAAGIVIAAEEVPKQRG